MKKMIIFALLIVGCNQADQELLQEVSKNQKFIFHLVRIDRQVSEEYCDQFVDELYSCEYDKKTRKCPCKWAIDKEDVLVSAYNDALKKYEEELKTEAKNSEEVKTEEVAK